MSEANVQVVREAYELIRRGDPRRMLELVAHDAVWQPAASGKLEVCSDGETVAKALMWLGAVHRLRAGELVDAGNRVVVGVSGRRLARFGASVWGRRFFQVVTVRDGRIVRIEDYERRELAFAAVGLK